MILSAVRKRFGNWKFENYLFFFFLTIIRDVKETYLRMYHLNNFQISKYEGVNQRAAEGATRKPQKNAMNIRIIPL